MKIFSSAAPASATWPKYSYDIDLELWVVDNMKAVILAGGLGTRISEETLLKPKPIIEIGGKPILLHIMKSYSAFGVNDFVICCVYKGYIIKAARQGSCRLGHAANG